MTNTKQRTKSGGQRPADSKSVSSEKSTANYQLAMDNHIAETKATADADLEVIKQALASFATKCKLNPEQQKIELNIRNEFDSVERAIFSTTFERGKVLLKYRALYEPLNKFKGFLAVLGVSKATAYRHMAEATGMLEPPSPKAAPKEVSKSVQAFESYERVLTKGSPKPSAEESDEQKADRVLDRITSFVSTALQELPKTMLRGVGERAMEAIAAEVARMTSRRVEELRAEAEKITALAAQIEAAALGNKSGKVTPQRIVIGGRTGLATHLATIPGAPNPIDVSPGAPGPLAVDVKGTPDEAVTGVTGVVDPTPKPEPAAASRQGQGTVSGGAR